MKSLIENIIAIAIVIVVFVEITVRLFASVSYGECVDNLSFLDAESRESFCSCKKDVLVSNRYSVSFTFTFLWLENVFKGRKIYEKADEKIPGFQRCIAIEQNAVKNKIKNRLENDVHDKVFEWLRPQTRHNLQGIILQSYNVDANEVGSYKYKADVYFTVSEGMLGIVYNTNFRGKFYYYQNGEFATAEWKQTSSQINTDRFEQGVEKFRDLFN